MEFKAGRIFPESLELVEFLNNHGFELYDAEAPFSWKQAARDGPAKKLMIGREYLLIVKPKKGQSPRDAFAETQGIGPALWIDDPKDRCWIGQAELGKQERIVLFTRLVFYPNALTARIRTSEYEVKRADEVTMRYESAMDTFRRFFIVQSPEDAFNRGAAAAKDELLAR